jgi:hypothetical protein
MRDVDASLTPDQSQDTVERQVSELLYALYGKRDGVIEGRMLRYPHTVGPTARKVFIESTVTNPHVGVRSINHTTGRPSPYSAQWKITMFDWSGEAPFKQLEFSGDPERVVEVLGQWDCLEGYHYTDATSRPSRTDIPRPSRSRVR